MKISRLGQIAALAALAMAATVLLVPAAAAPSAAATTPIALPHNDPFYRYHGTKPLAKIEPGTVLAARSVTMSLAGTLPTPVKMEQLLYRTKNQLGKPSVTVTTVIAPLGKPTKIVSYESFYDALGDLCDPSFTLRGGNPGTKANAQQADIEQLLITTLVAQGYAVTVPDFEGEGMHWVAGQESGWNTLDGIRATENYFGVPRSTKVGLMGYSGGAIGAEWASELAPGYAPGLNIVATAIGGIAVDLAHNLRYIDGSKDWSGVIPAVLVSLGRAFGVPMEKYESAYGKLITKQVSGQCIGSFNGAYPGLKVAKLLKPRYRHFLEIPRIARIVNHLTMGTTRGHPRSPMLMVAGNADGTGDGVMVVKDVQALGHEYCKQGVPVTFQEVKKAAHTEAGLAFIPMAEGFLAARFAGANPTNNCAKIPRGNSLAPLPVR